MFTKRKTHRVIFESSDTNTRILDIYKNKKGTFKLFCDVKRSSATIGINTNYCISHLSMTGWTVIADQNDLGLPKLSIEDGSKEVVEKIEAGFAKFIELADLI